MWQKNIGTPISIHNEDTSKEPQNAPPKGSYGRTTHICVFVFFGLFATLFSVFLIFNYEKASTPLKEINPVVLKSDANVGMLPVIESQLAALESHLTKFESLPLEPNPDALESLGQIKTALNEWKSQLNALSNPNPDALESLSQIKKALNDWRSEPNALSNPNPGALESLSQVKKALNDWKLQLNKLKTGGKV